jgi:hypothetical protein
LAPGEAQAQTLLNDVGKVAMAEALVLISCGAAFIAGLVIAATSLFG